MASCKLQVANLMIFCFVFGIRPRERIDFELVEIKILFINRHTFQIEEGYILMMMWVVHKASKRRIMPGIQIVGLKCRET